MKEMFGFFVKKSHCYNNCLTKLSFKLFGDRMQSATLFLIVLFNIDLKQTSLDYLIYNVIYEIFINKIKFIFENKKK